MEKKMTKHAVSQHMTGVINPYALILSGKDSAKEWERLSLEQKKKKLEDTLGRPFHQLFDPKFGSPLFYPQNTDAPNDNPGTIITGEDQLRLSLSVGGWGFYPGKFLPRVPPDANDAIQGCSLDCWFIAALASIAWIWPDLIKNWYADTNPKTYLGFWKPNQDSTAPPPYMPPVGGNLWDAAYSPKIKYFASNYSLAYGEKGIGDWVFTRPQTPTPDVLWSALYEKSYANFYKRTVPENDTPDISKFNEGNPLISLIHLTGKRFYTKDDVINAGTKGITLTQTAFDITEFPDENTIFDKIYSMCYTIPGDPQTSSITASPMVAWTYPGDSAANTANGIDPIKSPEKSAKYTNDSIVAKHSYSILGVHIIQGKKYIVLRNPWGMSLCGGFGGDPKIIDPTPNDDADNLYYSEMCAAIITTETGTPENSVWTVRLPPYEIKKYNTVLKGAPSRTIDLRNSDGIFALRVDKFRWHFKGFGWVY